MKEWIRKIIRVVCRMKGSQRPRRFYHSTGFGDGTLCVEYLGRGKTRCVGKFGRITNTKHKIGWLEKNVADGIYYEK